MKILSRSMKSPPTRSWENDGWRAMVAGMAVGECLDLEVANMVSARKQLLRAGSECGFRVTTRKSDHASLEVYRLS